MAQVVAELTNIRILAGQLLEGLEGLLQDLLGLAEPGLPLVDSPQRGLAAGQRLPVPRTGVRPAARQDAVESYRLLQGRFPLVIPSLGSVNLSEVKLRLGQQGLVLDVRIAVPASLLQEVQRPAEHWRHVIQALGAAEDD